MWYLFDFDDVLTIKVGKRSDIIDLIRGLKLRKERKISLSTACNQLGIDLNDVIVSCIKSNKPNKKLLDKLVIAKSKGVNLGVASNNSPEIILPWLKYYGYGDLFSMIFTPDNLNWVWKPGRFYYSRITKILNVLPKDIHFYDDQKENIMVALKMNWSSHLYNSSSDYQIDTENKSKRF